MVRDWAAAGGRRLWRGDGHRRSVQQKTAFKTQPGREAAAKHHQGVEMTASEEGVGSPAVKDHGHLLFWNPAARRGV